MTASIDLHLHSDRSDGTLSPAQVVSLCADARLTTIALSDHDTVDGVEEALAAGEERGIEVIPAIEMSAGNQPEVHILGYYPDTRDGGLLEWLDDLRSRRAMRTARIVARLREIGIYLSYDDIQARANTRAGLGRMHVARAMVRAGYVKDISEAFSRYLAPGRPGYISRNNPPVSDVLAKMTSFGMIPVLAHGALLDAPLTYIADLIGYMASCGLRGVECYHSGYDRSRERFMLTQAKQRGLLVTGGSDYHGANRAGVLPGTGTQNWTDAQDCLVQLKKDRYLGLKEPV